MYVPDEETERTLASVVDAVGRVRAVLGVGLLESVYKQALEIELRRRGHRVERERRMHVVYEGVVLDGFYSADFIVDGVVVEAKVAQELHPTAFAQTLTYLRMTSTRIGLLVNFHAVPLRTGIHRIVRRDP